MGSDLIPDLHKWEQFEYLREQNYIIIEREGF